MRAPFMPEELDLLDGVEQPKCPAALASAQCPCCDARPETAAPLSDGWTWDSGDPVSPWAWCPECDPAAWEPGDHDECLCCDGLLAPGGGHYCEECQDFARSPAGGE